ncbi:hypothetical protein [Spirosoma foliorum]|uniref:Uncharacterized protein n=1 Tax=Spirosoma foliorum TaxID=2710596 RepID=A0A7G5H2M8_9BACT|nr:hypothetical protein [Spirosoma foliorum]QMW05370.1 hypothetical protein H3H32_10995 [Spirosoma foliorum]
MKTLERLVIEAIDYNTKEVARIKALLDVNPYSAILELEHDTIEECKKLFQAGESAVATRLLDSAQLRKKELMEIVEQQKDTTGLISRMVDLEHELYDLYIEKARIDRQNERKRNSTT